MIKKKILIATGGTGGHIFPALSLAKNLIKKNYDIILTSDKRGFKYLSDINEINFKKITSSPLVKKNIFTLIYSALLANDQENKLLIDYDKFDVGVWMEDLQSDDLDKIVAAMMESRILGNDLNAGMARNVKQSTKGK